MDMYYLYRHIRLDNNEPFYIGIGTVNLNGKTHNSYYNRAFDKRHRKPFWKNIINKTDYKVEILLESNDNELIKQKEIEFISLYGRKDLNKGTLVNLTDGGEGTVGIIVKESTREKLRAINIGKKCSEETKEKCRVCNKAKGWEHVNAKRVINYETKEIFPTIREASRSIGISPKELGRKLKKYTVNTTDMCLLEDYNVTFFGNISKERATTGKKVKNIKTGEIFSSISKASLSVNMKQATLSSQIRSGSKKSIFIML